jgi:hypothetical protein
MTSMDLRGLAGRKTASTSGLKNLSYYILDIGYYIYSRGSPFHRGRSKHIFASLGGEKDE